MDLMTQLFGVFYGGLPMLLGMAIGICIARRREKSSSDDRLKAERAQQIMDGLLEWANTFAGDVTEYRSQMEEISRKLDENGNGTGKADGALVAPSELLARMTKVNDDLRARLDAAEQALNRQAEDMNAYLSEARTDTLTRLPNRRAFDEELSRRFAEWDRRQIPLSVLICDIDKFKAFNDRYGHLAGDEILKRVAAILGQNLRGMDMVARFGGEEFALVLPTTELHAAEEPAERIRQSVEQAVFSHRGVQLSVTISCGVAEAMPGEDMASLLGRADQALYASKNAGRNCCHRHNGFACEPLGAKTDKSGDLTGGSDTDLANEFAADFSQVCDDLRDRLVERATSNVDAAEQAH